jgi:hypothetical protein
MDLSGAETYPNLSCGAGFARLDNGTMTLRQITGHGKTGSGSPLGLLLASISVQFGGVPPTGLILQIPSGQVAEQFALNTAAPGFTEVSIILVDSAGGQKDYYSDNPDGGMSLSLKQATLATLPDGGGILPDAGLSSDFWCLHGHITADVPNLTPGPVTVIHVSADF